MVKRLLSFTAVLLLSVSMFAQKEAPIKFLGIPIDGTKAAMIEALKDKGFDFPEHPQSQQKPPVCEAQRQQYFSGNSLLHEL